jgi:hypothetical protein
MGRDASLNDFLGDDEDEDDGGEAPADADATADPVPEDEPEAPLAPDSVASATTTYDWSPERTACAACGATVAERWVGDAGLVCPDCKEW